MAVRARGGNCQPTCLPRRRRRHGRARSRSTVCRLSTAGSPRITVRMLLTLLHCTASLLLSDPQWIEIHYVHFRGV